MKSNVYKPSSKKAVRRPKKQPKNKWFVIGGIVLIAIIGIIAIRVSQAAVGVYSGRMPETGEPHINYTVNLNGTVTLTKSTNGETRTAGNIDEAYVIGEQMYNEMIAAQSPPPSTPPPASAPSNSPPSSTPSTSTNPSSTPSTSTTTPDSNNNQVSTDQATTSSGSGGSNANKNSISTIVKKFLITLRRKVSIVPKIPENVTEIGSVVLLIDGDKVAESNTPNYLIMLDTTKYSNGTHTLTTQIVNESGSIIGADSYTIKIDNTNSWIDKLLWIFGY